MSNSVDNRVVQMEFDNKQFEKGVKTTLGSLDKLSKSLRLEDSSKGLKDLQRTADKFNMESVGQAADQAGMRFTAMQVVAFTALQRITNAALTYGKRIASALTIQMPKAGFSKYEESINAVQTIMFATGKSIDEVQKVLDRLLKYTDETSYNFTEMSSSIGKFTSAGVDLDRAEVAMEGIANWAASAGVGINKASSAFYNMSQAISAGSMKMLDWKSIINLNMNTRQFKETAIETANEMLKLGTLTGQAASKFRSARVTVDNFDQTLSKGWFTTELMLATLEKYADQTTEFGLRAYHAAQEAKTFTDVVDAMKDALSTGWSKTWEYIFGNKIEAAEMWTGLVNGVAEFTGRITEARNKSLLFWHDMNGRKFLIEGFTSLLQGLGDVGNTVLDSFGAIFNPKDRGYTANTSKIQQHLDALGMTREEYQKLIDDYRNGLIPEEEMKAIWDWDDKYQETFNKMFGDYEVGETIEEYRERIEKGWESIRRGDLLIDLSKRFRDWAESIRPSEEQLEKVGKAFSGIFSIVKIGLNIFKSFARVIKPVGSVIGAVANKALDLAANIGVCITRFANWLEENDYIYKAFKKVYDFIAEIISKIPGWIDTAVTKFEELTGLDLHTKKFESFGDALEAIVDALKTVYHAIKPMAQAVWEMIKPFMDKAWAKLEPKIENIGQKLGGFIGKLVNAAKKVKAFIKGIADGIITIEDVKEKIRNVIQGIKDWWNALKNGEKTQWLTDVYETIADWAKRIKEKLQPLVDWLEKHLAGLTPNKLLFGGLGVALMVFLIGIGKLTSKAGGWIGSLTDISNAITGFFKGLKTKIKLDAIRKLIIAIALLTAAIGGLAYLEKNGYNIEHAAKVLANLILLLGALGIVFAILNKINIKKNAFGFKGGLAINNFATMMLAISAAVGIIVLSLAGLEKIKSKQEDFIILGTIIATMSLVAILLSNLTNGKSMAKGGFFLLSFALSVGLIVKALDKINQETIDKVAKNLGVIVGVILLISTIAIVASNIKAGSIVSMIGVAAFIFIIFNLFKKIGELEWKNNDNLRDNVSSLLLTIALMLTGIYVVGRIMDPNKMLKAAAGVGILAWSLRTIAQSFYILDKGVIFSNDLLKKVGLMLGVVAMVMLIAALLSSGEAGVFKGLVAVSGIAAVILALTVAFLLLKNVNWQQMLAIAFDMGLVIVAIGSAFGIAKSISGDPKPILAMAVAILAITAALGFLSSFTDMTDLFNAAGILSLVIVALGGALALASKTSKGNLGSIIAMVAAVGIITTALIFLQKYDIKQILFSALALSLVMMALGGALAIASKSGLGFTSIFAMSIAIIAVAGALWLLSEVPFDQLIGEVIAIGGAFLIMVLALKLLGNTGWTLAQVSLNMIVFAAACAAVGAAMWVVGWGFEKLIESMGPAGQTILRILEKIFGWLELVIDAIDWFIQGLRTLFDSIPSWDSIMNKLGGAGNNRLPMEALDMSGAWLDAGNEMQEGTALMEDAVERAGALNTGPTRLNRAAGDSRHDRPVVTVPEPDVEQAAAVGAETQNAVIDAQIETAEARNEEVAQANMGWLETIKEKYGPDVLSFESLMSDSMGGEGMANLLSGNGMFDITSLIDKDGLMSSLTGIMGEGGSQGAQELVSSFGSALTENYTSIQENGKDLASNVVSGIQEKKQDIIDAGTASRDAFAEGIIKDLARKVKPKGAELTRNVAEGANGTIGEVTSVAWNIIAGFVSSLTSNDALSMVLESGVQLGQTAIAGIAQGSEVASPSKAAYRVGVFTGQGLTNGLESYRDRVFSESFSIGQVAIEALNDTLSMIQDQMDREVIMEPIIRPVVDMSNMTDSTGMIGLRLNGQSNRAANALSYARESRNAPQIQNGSAPKVEINITTQELSNSQVDYLIKRVNRVLGASVNV